MTPNTDRVISIALSDEDWRVHTGAARTGAVAQGPDSRDDRVVARESRSRKSAHRPRVATSGYCLVAGVGCRSVYDVRDHTLSPSRFTFTSILRVRFSGSGFDE